MVLTKYKSEVFALLITETCTELISDNFCTTLLIYWSRIYSTELKHYGGSQNRKVIK